MHNRKRREHRNEKMPFAATRVDRLELALIGIMTEPLQRKSPRKEIIKIKLFIQFNLRPH
ncbi:hypothetical protein AVM02_12505 [Brucella anthropi]